MSLNHNDSVMKDGKLPRATIKKESIYWVDSYTKIFEEGMVVQACKPSTLETEASSRTAWAI
jgi:hypothetical protein